VEQKRAMQAIFATEFEDFVMNVPLVVEMNGQDKLR